MHDDNEYFRSRLASEFWYLRRFHWDYDPPEEPKDHRTPKSIATIDELKRRVGVQ